MEGELPFVENRADLKATEKAHAAQQFPYKVQLKQGETYYYCTCGKSSNQPFCNGAHKDCEGYKPLKYTHEGEDQERYLCGCKQNKVESGVFCDGTHKTIEW